MSVKSLVQCCYPYIRVPVDLAFSVLVAPAAWLLLAYRRIGSARLPYATALLQKIGLFPIMRHYYEPLFNTAHLKASLSQDRNLPGIDLNETTQLQFLETLTYATELTALNLNQKSTDITHFAFGNGSFEAGDADYLYQFLRAVKPGKVIEIGSGNSTKIAVMALQKNREEGKAVSHLCIEPYEMPWLESLDTVQVMRKRIEECDINWAKELSAGDLLFIDSSHIIRPQGDVLKEFLEILPMLAPGVYVHIHDIFTPKDYLPAIVVDDVRFWNEQYLLEALLSHSTRYEIIGALNFLKHHHYEAFKKVCPYVRPEREPGSFYIRVRSGL